MCTGDFIWAAFSLISFWDWTLPRSLNCDVLHKQSRLWWIWAVFESGQILKWGAWLICSNALLLWAESVCRRRAHGPAVLIVTQGGSSQVRVGSWRSLTQKNSASNIKMEAFGWGNQSCSKPFRFFFIVWSFCEEVINHRKLCVLWMPSLICNFTDLKSEAFSWIRVGCC